MIRELCRRCGIYTGGRALCRDCLDVQNLPAVDVQICRRPDGSRYVKSSRRGAVPRSDSAELLDVVRRRTLAGASAVEIALEIGVTSRTVVRMRARVGVHGVPIGEEHRDYEHRIRERRTA